MTPSAQPRDEDIAFDESGYTGEHLLDPDQCVFALASCRLSEEDARQLLNSFHGRVQGEYKYAKIKRAKRNWPLIAKVLKDSRLNPSTCKIYVIHKPFMVVSKLIDNIYEPLARQDGIDLYERKAALDTANLLAITFPMFLGRTRYTRLLSLYSQCCRSKDPAVFRRFAAECEKAFDYLDRKDKKSSMLLSPVIQACRRGHAFIQEVVPESDHDPAIAAYYVLANAWSKEIAGTFNLIGDESKILRFERDRLLKFSDPNLKEIEVPYYDNTAVYPLRIRDVVFAESSSSYLVQMADFMAGVTCHAFNEKAASGKFDEYGEQLAKLLLERQLIIGGLWPGTDVTPEGLEATGAYGENPVDYATRILRDDPSVRRHSAEGEHPKDEK